MTGPAADLPLASAPHLTLVQATLEERLATWQLNGKAWAGRMLLETYVRREEHLADQSFTRSGGITFWILVEREEPPNQRRILASCESLRKRALVARAEKDGAGDVEEVVSHGIGSVFVHPEHRGKGYATRMLQELAQILDTWQQPYGRKSDFTVLFSDIGKNFYSQVGWNAFSSTHISLPGVTPEDYRGGPTPRLLVAGDLATLCAIDESRIIRRGLVHRSESAGNTTVALIPDLETIQWHHAREEFFAREMLGKEPKVKGAYVHCKEDDSQVWCYWSRFFGVEASGDTFHILRLAIEGEEEVRTLNPDELESEKAEEDVDDPKVAAIGSLFRAAQFEAAKWSMKEVHLWNPTPLAVRAAQSIEPSVKLVYRSEESIASLRWRGSEDAGKVDWLGNEKYAWC